MSEKPEDNDINSANDKPDGDSNEVDVATDDLVLLTEAQNNGNADDLVPLTANGDDNVAKGSSYGKHVKKRKRNENARVRDSETADGRRRRDDWFESDDDDTRKDDKSTTTNSDDEDNIMKYDPTPYDNPYPTPNWFSVEQVLQRQYGKIVPPNKSKRVVQTRPFNSFWFRKYAYESLYFIQKLELMDKLQEHNGCVNCLNFNSSGDLLCSGSDDLQICVWMWQKAKCLQKYQSGHTSNVFQCKWCLDNSRIISCARDGQVRICDVENPVTTESKKLAQHKGPAHKVTLTSPNVALSCGEDAVVYEIDLRTDKPNKILLVKESNDHRVPLYSINSNMIFNPYHFLVCGRSPVIRVFDRRFLPSSNGSSITPLKSMCPSHLLESRHSVTCASYNSTASEILSSYNDEDMYIFNASTGEKEKVFQGHRNSATVKGCSWFGDDFVLSGSDDGYVYGWHKKSQHIVVSLYADENGVVNCLEPHPTSPILATSGLDDDVKLWVPSSPQWPQTLKGIKQRICSNVRDRRNEQKRAAAHDDDFDTVDASMIWFLIRQIRQRQRGPSDDNGDDDDDDLSDTDGNQCAPS